MIVQYRPPADLSVIEAAELLQRNRLAVVAQLMDFAARHLVVFLPGPKRRSFRVVRTEREATVPAERAVLAALFDGRDESGASVTLTRHRNAGLSRRMADAHREISASLITRGLMHVTPWPVRLLHFWNPQPVRPTALAHEALQHLAGSREYIRLAEAERMSVLLSPDAAVEKPYTDGESMLVMHEKLLGYAVLFGFEKLWAARLAADYEAEPQDGGNYRSVASSSWVDVAVWEMVGASVDLVSAEIVGATIADDFAPLDLDSTVEAVDVLDGLGAFFGGL